MRGEGSDLADQRTDFDSESGLNTTGNGTCRSFSYEVQGRIVVIVDIYGALKQLTGTSTGGLSTPYLRWRGEA